MIENDMGEMVQIGWRMCETPKFLKHLEFIKLVKNKRK